jgi:hypothetical protein
MNEEQAKKIFYDYITKIYKEVDILSVKEKKERFLFEFCQKGDECPIDYPVISVNKDNGKVKELSFINTEDREIIFGE